VFRFVLIHGQLDFLVKVVFVLKNQLWKKKANERQLTSLKLEMHFDDSLFAHISIHFDLQFIQSI